MSTVQFNLLPDVKMTYVKAQRSQKLIISISVLVSAAAIALFVVVFFSVNIVQKKMLNDANKDIVSYTKSVKDVSNIDEALTIQNQLASLSTLHQNKHIPSRIFDYLAQITPQKVSVSQITIDFVSNTISITGKADSQYSVNKFIDTLRYANYKTVGDVSKDKAFTGVTETNFSVASGEVSYTLTASFNPILFSNNILSTDGKLVTPVIVVPDLTTTHSNPNDPANGLFNQGGSR
jgi:Tfp pilus assembly protein PilN